MGHGGSVSERINSARMPSDDPSLIAPVSLAALVTLQQAADLLTATFGAVSTRWGALDRCIELLIAAAESG